MIDSFESMLDTADCILHSIPSFNSLFSVDTGNFFVVHQNIRSFRCNIDNFILFIRNLNVLPDVIILTETFFCETDFHDIPGYQSHHSYRTDKRGGGVSVFVKSCFISSIVNEKSMVVDSAEICTVDISITPSLKIKFIGFYRPPSSDIREFCRKLTAILSDFSTSDILLLGGDANINLFNNNSQINFYTDLMHSYGCFPYISLPTRVSDSCTSLIDHFWGNILDPIQSGVFDNDITDHRTIFMFIPLKTKNDSVFHKKFRDHSNLCLDKLASEMKSFCETFHVFDDLPVGLRTHIFFESFWDIYDKNCPIRTKVYPTNILKKPWLDADIIELSKIKQRLFRSYKLGTTSFNSYSSFKNQLTSIIKRCKKNYYCEKFEKAKGDVRKTWSHIGELMGCKKKRDISEIDYNNTSITSNHDMAQIFFNYFDSVPSDLRDNMPNSLTDPLSYLGPPLCKSFEFVVSDANEISKIIESLKDKSCKLDCIPVFIYKHLNNFISDTICNLFNSSVLEGIFPDILKQAKVTPIYKSGSSKLINSYRPISILSTLSKIFEKLMCKRFNNFLETNNILCKQQFGFRSNSSTSDAIVEFLDLCYGALDVKKCFMSVFLDLSKAFDTLDHNILMSKLSHIGIEGSSYRWFLSYLLDREQQVSIGLATSSIKKIKYGVPQGSVLSPILFLVYINDMYKSSDKLNFVHFADDSTVFCEGSDATELGNIFNAELQNVDKWLISNKLSLNLLKTKYMIFSHKVIPDNLVVKIIISLEQ